ncbi:MAG: hypothetical protein PHG85_06260 [Candidatus Altiarchaeota archaeon]|nr:hypothetical protein [Candidatus Altiarchaeota archaeon]
MTMDRTMVLGLVLALCIVLMMGAPSAEIIVINETKEQLYAVESVLLSGDLSSNSLTIAGNGEVILGENVKIYLFGPSPDILIRDVSVNGQPTTVSFDKDGYFFLAPEKGKFDFTGRMDIRTIGQITLHVRGPLNELKFKLDHGYSLNGDEYGLYDKDVIIQRSEKSALLVDGNFRYTYAERDEFYYQLGLQSFGSSLGRYTLYLNNNERVSSVDGVLKWEQAGNTLLLDLEGSKASVGIRGLFSSTSLRIPLKEDRHHVLIESDPEKRITISTTAKELDLSESPLSPQYSNARAFLASGYEAFEITVKQLDLLPSLAATADRATNRIAITKKGSIVGELTYSPYKNTGLDYIEIETPGVPLYASTGGGAVKLTKDNTLLLSFPKTNYGSLDLVYFNTTSPLGLFSVVDVPTARTEDLIITEAATTIYLPADQFVIKTLGAEGGSELPSLYSVVVFVVIFGALGLALRKDAIFIAAYLLFTYILMYSSFELMLLWLGLSLALLVRRVLPGTSTLKWLLAGAAAFVVIGIILIVPLAFIFQMGAFSMGSAPSKEYETSDYAVIESAQAPMIKSLREIGSGEGAISVPTRTGVLPVKLELPTMGKSITLHHDLVSKEEQVALTLLLVSTDLKYIGYLIGLCALSVAVRRYSMKAT